MIVLGLIEYAGRGELCDNRRIKQIGGLYVSQNLLGDFLLAVITVENFGAVLRSGVIALTVQCGRIVDLKEKLQYRAVIGLLRIKGNLDGLGMARIARAYILIGRVHRITAGIAYAGVQNAGLLADQIFHAPETATGQYCFCTCHAFNIGR